MVSRCCRVLKRCLTFAKGFHWVFWWNSSLPMPWLNVTNKLLSSHPPPRHDCSDLLSLKGAPVYQFIKLKIDIRRFSWCITDCVQGLVSIQIRLKFRLALISVDADFAHSAASMFSWHFLRSHSQILIDDNAYCITELSKISVVHWDPELMMWCVSHNTHTSWFRSYKLCLFASSWDAI